MLLNGILLRNCFMILPLAGFQYCIRGTIEHSYWSFSLETRRCISVLQSVWIALCSGQKISAHCEMEYPKSKNPKPVYFLFLKLLNMSDYGILFRKFYRLHPSGGDYKLLEPYWEKKKIPLKITSKVLIKGSTQGWPKIIWGLRWWEF